MCGRGWCCEGGAYGISVELLARVKLTAVRGCWLRGGAYDILGGAFGLGAGLMALWLGLGTWGYAGGRGLGLMAL